jgi:hypothetical protein
MKKALRYVHAPARVPPEVLQRVIRNVFTLAVECGSMTPEELESAASETVEGMSRATLERLSSVASWAASALSAESVRR